MRVVTADAFTWLRDAREPFDAVIIDMPDPDSTATAKLYSVEFYSLARQLLAPGGRLVVQSGSPYFAPRTFDCIDATIRAAGFTTTPYHVNVPSFGDWGFILAQTDEKPALTLDPPEPLRFLDEANLAAAAIFPVDRRPTGAESPSTLDDPKIVRLTTVGVAAVLTPTRASAALDHHRVRDAREQWPDDGTRHSAPRWQRNHRASARPVRQPAPWPRARTPPRTTVPPARRSSRRTRRRCVLATASTSQPTGRAKSPRDEQCPTGPPP